MPDFLDPSTGSRMVWDSATQTYVEAEEYEGTPSHASGGDFQATDPAIHRMTPKNPLATGILAAVYGSISDCPHCGGQIGLDDHCLDCGQAAPDFGSVVNQTPGPDSFGDRVPVPNRFDTDRSFPTMSHTKAPDLWDISSERPRGTMQLTSDNAPTLTACPECGDPMTDLGNEAICHTCGHKQPILRVEARRTESFVQALIPLAMGALRAIGPKLLGGAAAGGAEAGAAGAAAGGEAAAAGSASSLGGLGKSMTKALGAQGGMSTMKGVLNSGDAAPAPGQDTLPVGPTPMGTIGAAAENGVSDTHGEDSNPEFDGTQGYSEQNTDAPEHNKDVNDAGGTMDATPEDTLGDFHPVGHDELTEEDIALLAKLTPDQTAALAHLGVNWSLMKAFADDDDLDGSKNPILVALDEMLEGAFPGYKGDSKKEASVDGLTKHAARLPRMCPHHKNLVSTSLATGDPAASLAAMAQHEYGEKSCNGSWEGEEGKGCKYKPQMVTQSFWDDRAEKRNERAEMRAEQGQGGDVADVAEDAQDIANGMDGSETPEGYEDNLDEVLEERAEFEPDPEWGDQSVEFVSEGEGATVIDFNSGETAVGMGEVDRQMAARVAGLAETFPEGSKVHWKFYDRGEGTVVGAEANQFEASHDAVEVRWGDGTTERVYPNNLIPMPSGDAQHPGTGHEMMDDHVMAEQPQEMEPPMDPQQGLVMASVEDFTFGTRLAEKSEYEPSNEGDGSGDGITQKHINGEPQHGISGGDNPDIVDAQGQPLSAGQSYLMRTPEYAVPDKVTIDHIDGDKITYTIHTDSIDYQDTMDLADMLTRQYEFEPDTGGDTPDGEVGEGEFAPDPEAAFGDDAGDIHKIQNGVDDTAVRSASVKTACEECDGEGDGEDGCSHCGRKAEPKKEARLTTASLTESMWHDLDAPMDKTAGADYSPREQREFIHEQGAARNLDRLKLEGTHYPQEDDLSDAFLFGLG